MITHNINKMTINSSKSYFNIQFIKPFITPLLALIVLNGCSSDSTVNDTTINPSITEKVEPITPPKPIVNKFTPPIKPVLNQRNDERSMQVGSNGQLMVNNHSNADINVEKIDSLVTNLATTAMPQQ